MQDLAVGQEPPPHLQLDKVLVNSNLQCSPWFPGVRIHDVIISTHSPPARAPPQKYFRPPPFFRNQCQGWKPPIRKHRFVFFLPTMIPINALPKQSSANCPSPKYLRTPGSPLRALAWQLWAELQPLVARLPRTVDGGRGAPTARRIRLRDAKTKRWRGGRFYHFRPKVVPSMFDNYRRPA